MKIRTVVVFDIPDDEFEDGEEFGIDIESEKMVGESVKIKSGEYENLLMGTIISAEEIPADVKKNDTSKELKKYILMEFLRTPIINRLTLLKKLSPHYESNEEVDYVMLAFNTAGIIEIMQEKKDIVYVMPRKIIDEYSRLFHKKA